MEVVNYTEFRQSLKMYLDNVTRNHDTLIVPRSDGESVVIISLDEYNSYQETLHLMKTEKNRTRLTEALKRAEEDNHNEHDLIEE